MNEDIRILLLRFDAETGDESEKDNESESTKSFLAQLATWHKEELDEKLANKVQVSQRAVAKIIQVWPLTQLRLVCFVLILPGRIVPSLRRLSFSFVLHSNFLVYDP